GRDIADIGDDTRNGGRLLLNHIDDVRLVSREANVIALEEHATRVDVPVIRPLLMNLMKAAGKLGDNLERALDLERAVCLFEHIAEQLSADELHRDVECVLRAAARNERDERIVRSGAKERHLGFELLNPIGVVVRGVGKDLYRNLARAELLVLSA